MVTAGIYADGGLLTHGWVKPLPGGAQARCGGPGICTHCRLEAKVARLTRDLASTAESAARFADEMTRALGRAEQAEGEADRLAAVLSGLLMAVDAKGWSEIDDMAGRADKVLAGFLVDRVRGVKEGRP